MCIIITKPKYTSMPSNNTMRRCWNANPQGAGFMFTDPATRQVHGKKGFMKFEEFIKELSNPKMEKMNVVIHFRIATHGGINEKATHPFPVSGKTEDLNALSWSSRAGVAHNGIIPGYGSQKGLSDTQEWIKKVAASAGEHILHPGVLKVLEATIGSSRVAIMRRDKIVRLGAGWVLFKGCWYSNSGYKKPKYVQNKICIQEDGTFNFGKNTHTYPGWSRPVPKLPPITKSVPLGTIRVEPKPVSPIVPEPTGYGVTSYRRHEWCDGNCLGCTYNENGVCMVDTD